MAAIQTQGEPQGAGAPAGPPQPRLCPRCSTALSPGQERCFFCGWPPAPQQAARRTAGWRKGLVILVVSVAVIVGAVVGMKAAGKKSAPPPPQDTRPGGYLGTVIHTGKVAKEQLSLIGVRQAIRDFQLLEGRLPKDLNELAERGTAAPPPPADYRYEYDPRSGEVSLQRTEPPAPAP